MNDALAYPVSDFLREKQNEGLGINLFGLNFGMFSKIGGESVTAGAWCNIRWHGGASKIVVINAMVDPKEESLQAEFNERADKWERDTAIFSSPGASYLNKDYMVIIARGIEYPKIIVPLILNRISLRGGDWFFALEQIADQNPAENCEDYETALAAWVEWAKKII